MEIGDCTYNEAVFMNGCDGLMIKKYFRLFCVSNVSRLFRVVKSILVYIPNKSVYHHSSFFNFLSWYYPALQVMVEQLLSLRSIVPFSLVDL